MPAILTVITEDDLLDFANNEVDAETQKAVRAAVNADRRVRRMLEGVEQVDSALRHLAGPRKTP